MLPFLLAASLAFTPADAHLAYETAKALVAECTPRDAGTIRGRIASNWILDRTSALGVDVRRDAFSAEALQGKRDFVNLYAKFRTDATSRWVVVVSHYDTKPGTKCPGANDGASTVGLLHALANAISNWKTPHGNILLVWTDAEECAGETYSVNDGFQGSVRAAERLREEKLPVQAVICIDMLGDKDLAISIPANGSTALAKIAQHAAKRAGYPGLVTFSEDHVKDDHVAFLDRGFKAIDLIDFTYGSQPGLNDYWHTPQDTPDKISEESLLKSGKLVTEMLNILL